MGTAQGHGWGRHRRRPLSYEAGVSWRSVGDALGIRRGAVYQWFRRKPVEPTRGSPDTWPKSESTAD